MMIAETEAGATIGTETEIENEKEATENITRATQMRNEEIGIAQNVETFSMQEIWSVENARRRNLRIWGKRVEMTTMEEDGKRKRRNGQVATKMKIGMSPKRKN